MAEVKIVAVGAASASFGLGILRDFIGSQELAGSHLALVDIDEPALEVMLRVGQRMIEAAGTSTTISAHTDVSEALPEADYVLLSVAVARLEGWRLDWEVPLKHGLKQVFAENAGIGGMFQLMRNLPPALAAAREVAEICPDALVINFCNPLPRMVYALSRYADVRVVGLCHCIEGVRDLLSRWLGVPRDDLYLLGAGINHFGWLLDARRQGTGEDLYPALRELCSGDSAPDEEPLCQELMRRFGLFTTCGDCHVGEFLPVAMFEDVYPFPETPPPDWPDAYPPAKQDRPYGWVGFPWRYDYEAEAVRRAEALAWLHRIADGQEDAAELLEGRSGEYAHDMIAAIENARPWLCPAVSVVNEGYISNVPRGGVVEVPALVDGAGIHPLSVGPLPEGPAQFVSTQLHIQPLAARAAAEGDLDAALQALYIEPSVGCFKAAQAAFEELLDLERQWLPQLGGAL